jgi:DNA-binding transcriptional LysR family regulator
MSFDNIEYIITVAKEHSQSRAADQLLVSQSTISQYIRKVEKELGVKLFKRNGNQLVLTDSGKIYLSGAESALALYEKALDDLRTSNVARRKQIVIMYNPSLIPQMRKVLTDYISTHKNIFVSTLSGPAEIAKEYLMNGMADIAVLPTQNLYHAMLEYIPLWEDELQLAIPMNHHCAAKFMQEGVCFDDLSEDFFILNLPESYITHHSEQIFREYHFHPVSYCDIEDLKTARNMVMNGRGIAFLPSSMHQGGDYRAFSFNPPARFYIVIGYHKNTILKTETRELINQIRKCSLV